MSSGWTLAALPPFPKGRDDEAAARQMKAACEKSQAVCTSLKKEKKTAAPPKLFDLTALQREANRLYGFYGETDPWTMRKPFMKNGF